MRPVPSVHDADDNQWRDGLPVGQEPDRTKGGAELWGIIGVEQEKDWIAASGLRVIVRKGNQEISVLMQNAGRDAEAGPRLRLRCRSGLGGDPSRIRQ
jgi:hypothetical protein